jgi:hypothetical protein
LILFLLFIEPLQECLQPRRQLRLYRVDHAQVVRDLPYDDAPQLHILSPLAVILHSRSRCCPGTLEWESRVRGNTFPGITRHPGKFPVRLLLRKRRNRRIMTTAALNQLEVC